LANPFRVGRDFQIVSQGSRSSNPGLKLANAFGVAKVSIDTKVLWTSRLDTGILRKQP